jgi:uncharacterized beta-barrel protein YwiB (DUF1934 family)
MQLSQLLTTPLRYQDAERDSSSTLTIQRDNVKALFRRGQARMQLENLDGSQDGETLSTAVYSLSLTIALRSATSPQVRA